MTQIRTITSCGNSLAVTLPKELTDRLEVQKGSEVHVSWARASNAIMILNPLQQPGMKKPMPEGF